MPRTDSKAPILRPIRIANSSMWYVSVYFPDTKRRQRISLGIQDEAAVDAALAAFEKNELPQRIEENARIARAPKPEPTIRKPRGTGPKLRALADWYRTVHLPSRVKPRTLAKYTQVLDDFLIFCRKNNMGRLSQISMRKLEEWLTWMDEHRNGRQAGKHANKSRRDSLTIIRAWLNAAARADEIPASPIKYWDLPKRTKGRRQRALHAHELQECLELLDEHSPAVSNLVHFLAASGWRVSDAIDLRWGEVEFRKGELGQSIDRDQIKTSDGLLYPITQALRCALQHELDRLRTKPHPNDYVFLNASQEPWTYNTVYRLMTRALDRAGFPKQVSPHTFRTTFGTLAARAGVNPKVLQNLMGHSNIQTTLKFYTEVTLDDLTAGAEQTNTFAARE